MARALFPWRDARAGRAFLRPRNGTRARARIMKVRKCARNFPRKAGACPESSGIYTGIPFPRRFPAGQRRSHRDCMLTRLATHVARSALLLALSFPSASALADELVHTGVSAPG